MLFRLRFFFRTLKKKKKNFILMGSLGNVPWSDNSMGGDDSLREHPKTRMPPEGPGVESHLISRELQGLISRILTCQGKADLLLVNACIFLTAHLNDDSLSFSSVWGKSVSFRAVALGSGCPSRVARFIGNLGGVGRLGVYSLGSARVQVDDVLGRGCALGVSRSLVNLSGAE